MLTVPMYLGINNIPMHRSVLGTQIDLLSTGGFEVKFTYVHGTYLF
jgi:hypothetical protein